MDLYSPLLHKVVITYILAFLQCPSCACNQREKMSYDHSYFSIIGQLESIKDLKKAYILTLKCALILISIKCHCVNK